MTIQEQVIELLNDEGIEDEEIYYRAIELVERLIELEKMYKEQTKH